MKTPRIQGVWKTVVLLGFALASFSCEKSNDSFSLMSEQNIFKQSTALAPRKIDILWVIDNSGSMLSSQTNVANNFRSFINSFSQKNYDFHIGVTTTAAYLAYHYNDNLISKLKDGAGSSHSGVFVIDKNTPNLDNVFLTNIMQGTSGTGDERAFMSLRHTLENPLNASLGFKRPGSFLAVIIVSDEEDFSHSDYSGGIASFFSITNVNDSRLHTVQSYVDFLNQYTSSTAQVRNYSVSAIYVPNSTCLSQIGGGGQRISTRYAALADATGGVKTSLCGNFADSLQLISDTVLDLASVFQLDRQPIPETIAITVNGVSVAQGATNGWTYEAAANTISFHGSAVPPADASIVINFDPVTVKQ